MYHRVRKQEPFRLRKSHQIDVSRVDESAFHRHFDTVAGTYAVFRFVRSCTRFFCAKQCATTIPPGGPMACGSPQFFPSCDNQVYDRHSVRGR